MLQLTLQKDAVIDFYPGHIYTGYMVCIIHGSGRAAKNINRGVGCVHFSSNLSRALPHIEY